MKARKLRYAYLVSYDGCTIDVVSSVAKALESADVIPFAKRLEGMATIQAVRKELQRVNIVEVARMGNGYPVWIVRRIMNQIRWK